MSAPSTALLRTRDEAAKVLNLELFFDLVYVFAITQLSHYLLGHLTPLGVLQAATMWFAVWLGWQYTAWVTNWFNPDNLSMRFMLMALMIAIGIGIPARKAMKVQPAEALHDE